MRSISSRSLAIAASLVAFAASLYAASTGTTSLHTPQSGGTATTQGDYVSCSAALNTTYHYWVEVPPGLTRLRIQLFDPDFGIGNGNGGEDLLPTGRDRWRGANTPANATTYSLFNPSGASRNPLFTSGSSTVPAGSDGAWTSIYDSTGDTYRDNFTTIAYTNNDGTNNWATNWLETNDDNNAGAGLIQIVGGLLRIRDNGNAANSMIAREANLTGFTTATLTYDFTSNAAPAGSQFIVQASNNGGTTYTTIKTYTFPVANGSESLDLTPYIAANTRIRFATVGTTWTTVNNAQFTIDNLQIADSAITNGHWEIRIDQTSAVTTGIGINHLGIRADDGDATSGGTELNVYADSMFSIGANPPTAGTNTRNYTLYPYITSGCSCNENDFDYDTDSGNTGSMTMTSRTGAFTQNLTSASLSPDNTWTRNTFSGWVNDNASDDFGIWTLAASISSYVNGNGQNGNYATVYIGTSQTGANPPTANPYTATMRTYLPTDAGGAPSKPYLAQFVSKKFISQGNLAVGSPQTYTVTIRMTNPSAQAITFSNTNLITANIPGAGATYSGNAVKTQGTIVSQPAVGGTGNITWNPGTIAAAGEAVLAYDVKATATSAGQRIPVTATPASGNATRATFVDETGNTTQARATYTFGPICELAVTEGLVTEALVSSFEVAKEGNATVVEWTTSGEAGTVGYLLERLDRATGELVRVNEGLLPANAGAAQGGHYRYIDSKPSGDPVPAYYLIEITSQGKRISYGPFTGQGGRVSAPRTRDAFEHEPKAAEAAKHFSFASEAVASNAVAKKAKPVAAMVGVRTTGIVRVSSSDLAAVLTPEKSDIQNKIRNGKILVTSRGQQVAWTPSPDGDAILFFGEKSDSIYSQDRVYRIDIDKGPAMATVPVAASSGGTSSFLGSSDAEVDNFPATALPLDPDNDYWFWDFIIPGDATDGRKQFTVNAPSMATASGASLQVRLQGAIATNSHRAHIRLNGVLLGDVTFTALNAGVSTLTVPGALLHEGANTVEVEGVLDGGATFDVFYVDGFQLRYQRFAKPDSGRIEVATTPGSPVNASGFNPGAMVFDISNRLKPSLLQAAESASGTFSFVAPAAASSLFFSDAASVVTPSFVRGSNEISLKTNNRADYVVIVPYSMRSNADGLALLRQREGLTTYVADLDQIYDEFSGGNPTPKAIRDFLSQAATWPRPPKYVVLGGIGTVDYRGLFDSPGLVPPMMVKTSGGLYASDSLFADRNGDGLPDVAIGRIPVLTAAEFDAYVRKLDNNSRYSANGTKMLFSADAVDRGADFRSASQRIEPPLVSRPIAHAYLDDLGATGARNAIFNTWHAGSPLVSWVGHGGLDRLSNASTITNDDVPNLTSAGVLPIFVAMTCTINRFEVGTTFPSLGGLLTKSPTSGAIAVWSASGLSVNADATGLQASFMRLASKNPTARIGDLIVQSLAANASIGETGSVYLLLGDPAIRLSLPPETPVPAGAPAHIRE